MTTASLAPSLAPARRPFTLRTLIDIVTCAFEMKRALGAETALLSSDAVSKLRRIADRV